MSNDQSAMIGRVGSGIKTLNDLKGLANTVKREDIIIFAAYHDQLFGRNHGRQVAHIKVTGNAGDVITGAVVGHYDRIVIGADRARGHVAVKAMLKASGIISGSAATRIAHENRALHGDNITEMRFYGVQNAHDVPNALTDQRPSVSLLGTQGGACYYGET